MRFIVIAMFLSTGLCAKGQVKKQVDIPYDQQQKDTSSWFRWNRQLTKLLKLSDLTQNKDQLYFRFWTDHQLIEIRKVEDSEPKGRLVNFALQYRNSIDSIEKIYQNEISLSTDQTNKILNYLNTQQIIAIPAGTEINGWPKNGLDGTEFYMEFSTPDSYSFKTYWSPQSFKDSIPQARNIWLLLNFLEDAVHMRESYKSLKLPAGGHFFRSGTPGINISALPQYTYPPTNKSVLETLQ